jgi:hypothetical protein
MANTIFQIKRSEITAVPTSLQYGELAYSFASNKLFIGNNANSAITIGGNYYTSIIDAATAAATPSTLVLRDAQGNFSANTITAELNGNAATASKLQSSFTLSTSGAATGSVNVDGSSNVDIQLTLANTTVVAGTYGDTLHIPVVTVNEKGLITSMNTATISTSFDLQADVGGPFTFNNGDTLFIMGGDGIDTEVANNTFTVAVDNTVIRNAPNYINTSATSQSITGGITLSGDLTVSGNVSVTGTTTYINVETLTVTDSLIQLANNNTSDVVSIGFVGRYNDGTAKSTGFFRSVGDKEYYLFDGVTDPITGNVIPTANNFALATLNANFSGGVVSGLASAIAVADGGTGATSFTQGQHITFDGTKLVSMANTGASGIHGAANTYSELTVDNYGQITSVTQKAIAIDTTQITSGTLTTDRGGIGLATGQLLTNSVMFYNGTGTSMSQAQASTDGQILQFTTSGGVAWGMLDAGTF